jgi:3-deoxy-D-arabino-heptulosonate 7-phosphate (DAHP) synthase
VHPAAERALSDGAQSLDPGEFAGMMQDLGRIAEAIGRSLAVPAGASK